MSLLQPLHVATWCSRHGATELHHTSTPTPTPLSAVPKDVGYKGVVGSGSVTAVDHPAIVAMDLCTHVVMITGMYVV